MPIKLEDISKYRRPKISISGDMEEFWPRLKDMSHEDVLNSLPFDVIEEYVNRKKLEKNNK